MTAPLLKNRVGVSTTTTGTGTVTLGAALTAAANILPGKWLAFGSGGAGIADGSVVRYLIIAANGDVEWGKGTLGGSGTTLTRTLTGSTTGSLLSLSGTSQVFIGAIGEDIVPYESGIGVAIAETTASTSSTTGALTVAGGLGIGGSAFIAASLNVAANVTSGGFVSQVANAGTELGSVVSANTPFIDFHSSGNNIDYDARIICSGGSASLGAATLSVEAATLSVNGTTASISTTTGALTVAGGVGIGGELNINGKTLSGGSVPAINWSQTWNNAGSRFTGNQFTVTPTAFVSASSVIDVAGTTSPGIYGFSVNGGTLGGGSTGGGIRMDGAVYGTSVATSDDATAAFDSLVGRNTDNGVGLRLNSTAAVMWTSSGNWWGVGDTFFTRAAAATIQCGQADAAAPVAQTIQPQSVVAGTSNTAGQNFTIQGSRGTGTGAGGAIVFRTAPAGSTGTAQNATAEAARFDSAQNLGIGATTVARRLHAAQDSATTNAVTYLQRLTSTSTGTPAIGIGVGIEFEVETAAATNKVGATIEAAAYNVTASSESFALNAKQMAANALQEAQGLSFLMKSLTANVAYTNNTSAQNWFATAGGVQLEGLTTYEFEGVLLQTPGTTGHTVGLSFAGTATLTSIGYLAIFAPSLVNATITTSNFTQVNTAASTVVTPSITTAGTMIYVRGLVRVNAAGTFIPQFTFGTAPGAGNNLANTFFKLRKVGSNTNVNQGNWA